MALRWKPIRRFGAGVSVAALWVNVGPGIASGIASTEQVFDPAKTPGLYRQTDFVRAGADIQFDSRVNPAISPRGTQIRVTFDRYHDVNDAGFSFGVLKAMAQQSFTFFNEKRVVTLRAQTATSHTGQTNVVPFYLQQTLGGPDDLRGFRIFRFSDNSKLTLNAEYRWEVASPLDMALFADGGKVFSDPGQLSLDGLESAVGFGLRFKTRTAVPLRVDFGFSREGLNLWFRFSDFF